MIRSARFRLRRLGGMLSCRRVRLALADVRPRWWASMAPFAVVLASLLTAGASFGAGQDVPAVVAADDFASSAIVPAAASQAGTAAEAVPEVPTPPMFARPEVAAGLPPATDSAVSLKKATGRFSMLAGTGNDLGMDMIDGEALFTLRDLPGLTFGPSAGVIFLDGPNRTDLPPRLYTAQFDVRWFGQIATPLFYEVAFMPAVFTDGENTGSDALRMQGRGVAYIALSEQTQLALGATYLDREDVPLLPIFGVLHSPSDDLKLELVFPRPRVLGRVAQDGATETWAYAAGELGGGSWAIERQNGREDIASYVDYRMLVGLEQRQLERWTANVEAGYVFGRQLEYESGRGDYDPDNTFLLRAGVSR